MSGKFIESLVLKKMGDRLLKKRSPYGKKKMKFTKDLREFVSKDSVKNLICRSKTLQNKVKISEINSRNINELGR